MSLQASRHFVRLERKEHSCHVNSTGVTSLLHGERENIATFPVRVYVRSGSYHKDNYPQRGNLA